MNNFWTSRANRTKELLREIDRDIFTLDFSSAIKQLGGIIALIMLWQKEYRIYKNLPHKQNNE